MSVNSEMTAIADLIRGLRGISGKMGLDAMKGHLQDEQDGLDSALAAITEKGVTVPAGTKVDGLAALIAAIEAGGVGLGSGLIKKIEQYTFVLSGNSQQANSSVTGIYHSLGQVPDGVMIIADRESVQGGVIVYVCTVRGGNISVSLEKNDNTNPPSNKNTSARMKNAQTTGTSNTFTTTGYSTSSFRGGVTYHLIVWSEG